MREVSDTRKFLYFAFRQLRRVPKEWHAHYKYELVNAARQRDYENSPVEDVASRPEYYKLNALKRGYHGVKWVLSRFDLDCPEIPEKFADPTTPLYTNEGDTYEGDLTKEARGGWRAYQI